MGRAAETNPVTAVIDADNHYYEPDDAFVRHLDPAFSDRALHIRRTGDGVGRPYFGDQPLYYLENSPADRMGRPGAWRHDKDGRYQPLPDREMLTPGQIPHFARREARLQWMDDVGVEACLMWPSLALGVEVQMRDDPLACAANFSSFNRWLDEDWGFDYQHRIFAAPWLTLVDIELAAAELDDLLARGAHAVAVLFSPVDGRSLGRSLFRPHLGPLRRGRRAGRLPRRRVGIQPALLDPMGRAGTTLGPYTVPLSAGRLLRAGHHGHARFVRAPQRVRAASGPPGAEHRERLGVGALPPAGDGQGGQERHVRELAGGVVHRKAQ